MGRFATNIAKELRELSSMPAGDPSDFFFSSLNEPLAPFDNRSALELLEDKITLKEVENNLAKGKISNTGNYNTNGEQTGHLNRSFTQYIRGSGEYTHEEMEEREKSRKNRSNPTEIPILMSRFSAKTKSEDALV